MRTFTWKPYPAVAVLLALTVFCAGTSLYLRYRTGTIVYNSLIWDIFLGWVPLMLSLIVLEWARRKRSWSSRIILLTAGPAWFFFLPNASYLVTELIHAFRYFKPNPFTTFWLHTDFWLSLISIFSTGLLGLLLFSLSLYIVHELVSESVGRLYGWLGAGFTIAVSSVGIYIGRFIRWNSWDVLYEPQAIISDMLQIVTDERSGKFMLAFTLLVFVVQALMYIFFHTVVALGKGSSNRLS
ncbi:MULTISPECIES: DUF1361 domain-containing protein [unclassified Paenibacillus]|uniref:DUF1361 domain-containing protein n=1 Tax=unclassified Paenibacillus TaxID=185978 RepID=UPI0009319A2A|nr:MULTISPECIES: DUF1361 domain-containing protein [unclassified Paenibacillus]